MNKYDDFEVYANYIKDNESNEEFAGMLSLAKDSLPEELEIDGIIYKAQK